MLYVKPHAVKMGQLHSSQSLRTQKQAPQFLI